MNHNSVSFIKSGIRILAGISLIWGGLAYSSSYLAWAGILLILAELLGILEELV